MKLPPLPPMRPGDYLRLRRQAAGLSIEQVAVRIAPRPHKWQATASEIAALERDAPLTAGLRPLQLVRQLTQAFRFEPGVWEVLAELREDPGSQLPVPRLCSGCGCSWTDPCHPGTGHECAWRPASETGDDCRCTACPLPVPASPVAASRPERLAA